VTTIWETADPWVVASHTVEMMIVQKRTRLGTSIGLSVSAAD
jgi:hypothetical protein